MVCAKKMFHCFLCALWALVLDYIWFNLLKATCDLTTERAACGNGGRKGIRDAGRVDVHGLEKRKLKKERTRERLTVRE